MIECQKNERDLKSKGFALLQKYSSFHPHSVILIPFQDDILASNKKKPIEWTGMIKITLYFSFWIILK